MTENNRRIVIVGRPNAGKSSIFNKFTKAKNRAIVLGRPGTTLDYRSEFSHSLNCDLVDTAGLSDTLAFSDLTNKQTYHIIRSCDAAIFVVDAMVGLTNDDFKYVHAFRKIRFDLKFILLVNKSDSKHSQELDAAALKKLNLGEPIYFSTEQNHGVLELAHAIALVKITKSKDEEKPETKIDDDIDAENLPELPEIPEIEKKSFKLSIVGRPNAGKSTLLNTLFKEDRVMVSPIPGTTRDTVSVNIEWNNYKIQLSDTAGIRRNKADHEELEKLAVNSAFISIQFSDIVILLVDGTRGFERQDLIIAEHTLREGRGLIIAINKWDAVSYRSSLSQGMKRIANKYLCNARVLFISALASKNSDIILEAAAKVYNSWNARISTGKLNNFLAEIVSKGKENRTANTQTPVPKYMTQYDRRPARFFISVKRKKLAGDQYVRYLTNRIREHFGFEGVPIRIKVKSSRSQPRGS